jgi:tetratricopeptide (TPR) repeat protein
MKRWTLGILFAVTVSLFAANPVVDEAKKKIADKKFDEAITQLETAHKAKPQPEVKKALGEAHLAKAESFMYNEQLPPRMKYPTALKHYREVLKYDKENKTAQNGITTIESIYKSMGRPVPQ